ncbi:MAG: FGGY-family carbohydrate kinase [Bacilli bacterium]|nr:FGGY-family carbohydrate kinase [Bacilli bacterium]
MKEPLMLSVDFGTQSVRASIFNKKGEIICLYKKPYDPPYHSPKNGYAEQDPFYYYECMCDVTNKLVTEHGDLMENVLGMSITFFRDSIVILDKENNVIRPAILWLDERRAEGKKKLPLISRFLFKLVGMSATIDLNRKRSMAVWLQENEPENWAKADKFMMISTFINLQLLGKYVDSPAAQAGHAPIDFKKRQWYKKDTHLKGQIFGVPRKMLCELVPVGEVMGEITEEASKKTGLPKGLKVFAAGSDKSCETLGLGAMDGKTASVSYGTACTVEVSSKKYSDAEPFLPAYPSVVKGYYNLDVQVYRGYWMLNWFSKEFGASETLEAQIQNKLTLELLNNEMMKIEPGCDGLVLQPYWGAGLRRPLAKGAIIGFSDVHTRVHLYRAIIEGIAYCLREGLELFENKRLHHKVDKIRISGGGSQSDAICQITADIFGLPVSRVQTFETSSLGAAMAGFIAAGEFKTVDEAVDAMVHQSIEFKPNMENHKKYDYLFEHVYMKMYPKLKNIYKDIKEFDRKNIKK